MKNSSMTSFFLLRKSVFLFNNYSFNLLKINAIYRFATIALTEGMEFNFLNYKWLTRNF
jgi:hypothetical protein